MNRRVFLAHLAGAFGAGLAGCSEVSPDDPQPNGSATDATVPTVSVDAVDIPTVSVASVEVPTVTAVEVNETALAIDVQSVEIASVQNPTVDTPTVDVSSVELCSTPPDDVDVVQHALVQVAKDSYFVEGTVVNAGDDTTCPVVVLEIRYPAGRTETDSLWLGVLKPGETSDFLLGTIDLSDADPDDVGYRIYVTGEQSDED